MLNILMPAHAPASESPQPTLSGAAVAVQDPAAQEVVAKI